MGQIIRNFPRRSSPLLRRTLSIAGLCLLAACTPRIDARGNLPESDRVLRIEPGVHTRQDVMALLGSPSTVGTFQGEAWYYVSKRTETVAFLEPEVKDRNIIVVLFDPQTGIVKDVRGIGLEDGADVHMVERETPTSGRSVSFFQQIFGNIGKFNKEGQ